MKRPLCALVLMGACSSGDGEAGAAVPAADSTTAAVERIQRVMPALPDARGGRIVALSSGRDTLAGDWPATAALCPEDGLLLIESTDGDIGLVLLLLLLPEEGRGAGRDYTVIPPDSVLVPGTARGGAQIFRARRAGTFEALSGTVRLEEVNRSVTGSFTGALRQTALMDTVLMAASFQKLPLDTLQPLVCGTAADSTGSSPPPARLD